MKILKSMVLSTRRIPETNHQVQSAVSRWNRNLGKWIVLASWCLIRVLETSAHAQSYSVDWHTFDGGGGTSTNGQYSLSGTIGQPAASATAMTNGQFSVTGGYWVLPQAVQTEGAPTLTIGPASPGFATISWTPNTPGFVLQETPNLSPPNWTNSVSGSTNPVVIQTTVPAKFFRLHKP